MTALEEIKKAEHKRIWLEPAGAPDRCWCQDNQWGDEGVEYVLASTLESLQRENEEKSEWIKAATTEITKAIGGGSEMFTPHGDAFRVDPAFVASFIQYRRERHAESKKASIQKERELIARAEAAEAEVKRLKSERLYILGFNDGWEAAVGEPPEDSQALASTGGEHHAE